MGVCVCKFILFVCIKNVRFCLYLNVAQNSTTSQLCSTSVYMGYEKKNVTCKYGNMHRLLITINTLELNSKFNKSFSYAIINLFLSIAYRYLERKNITVFRS